MGLITSLFSQVRRQFVHAGLLVCTVGNKDALLGAGLLQLLLKGCAPFCQPVSVCADLFQALSHPFKALPLCRQVPHIGHEPADVRASVDQLLLQGRDLAAGRDGVKDRVGGASA